MSRSRPNSSIKSPVKHYFEWSGSEGRLFFYDKEKGEKVFFPKLNFVVLDELHTVTGFSDKHNKGFRGTEVRDLDTPITMWVGKEKHSTALYSELKGINGVKYTKSVYIGVIKKTGPMELAKLTLKGAAFSAWINFLKGAEDYAANDKVDQFGENVGVSVVGKSKQKKKGNTKYYEPKFEVTVLTDEQDEQAVELDGLLQDFFDSKLIKGDEETEEKDTTEAFNGEEPDELEDDDQEEEEEHEDAEDMDDLPF